MENKFEEKIYAGVLGKIIGVYFGRPVEGWSYEKIMENFGEIDYYVNDSLKVPIIVPDDDISGTFAFVRTIEDNNFQKDLKPKAVGKTWLNSYYHHSNLLHGNGHLSWIVEIQMKENSLRVEKAFLERPKASCD